MGPLKRVFIQIGVISILLVSCIGDKSANKADNELSVFKVLTNQSEAWNTGNIKNFMEGYERSDSMQFIAKRGRTLGWQNVYENYVRHYPTQKDMGKLSFENLIYKDLSDGLAQVYGTWKLEKDSAVGGNFSLIMKHKVDGWKIIIDHTW